MSPRKLGQKIECATDRDGGSNCQFSRNPGIGKQFKQYHVLANQPRLEGGKPDLLSSTNTRQSRGKERDDSVDF